MMSGLDGPREEVYGMLARLFMNPPDDQLVRSLLGDDDRVDVETLAVEFTELLRGLRPTSPPPPYESLYREGVIHGLSTDQVVEAYAAFGVHGSRAMEGEPADHISFELDFMRHLATLEAEAVDPEDIRGVLQAEDRFLEEHLCKWMGGFSQRLEEHDGTGFYSGAASFTDRWVTDDLARVRERLGAVEVVP
jgi:TorA maturation chaperone TorD